MTAPLPYTRAANLPALLRQRILILDGAMGTMIQRYKLTEAQYRGERFAGHPVDVKGNNELLLLTAPEVIREIHEQYLAAGADLIETNTFGATTVAQEDYKMAELAYEMNVVAARLAREACDKYSTPDKPRFVAGAFGPTPKTASISPDVNDRARATSTSTSCATPITNRARHCSKAGRMSSWSRPSSIRSTPRPRCSPSTSSSRTSASACP